MSYGYYTIGGRSFKKDEEETALGPVLQIPQLLALAQLTQERGDRIRKPVAVRPVIRAVLNPADYFLI